ncbi:MAG: NCS2 family permease [Bacilli bacterium]
MKFFERIFHVKEKGGSIKNEIIGGLVTFIAMCYILPVNSSILSDAGMNSTGVFIVTALLSFLVTWIMGIVANYPVVLSAGMGLNAFLAYTVCGALGFSWQEALILLTVSGIIFFIISLTPIRKIIIESIPKDLKLIISASLGAFICFVGLRNSGVIVGGSTLVEMSTFANPAVIISVVSVLLCFGLMFTKNKIVRSLAVPISILFAAIVGLITSEILLLNSNLVNVDGSFVYNNMSSSLNGIDTTLPLFPTHTGIKFMDFSGVKDVVLFGSLNGGFDFGSSLAKVFSTPASYVAIFSLIFVNLFDTTATLLAIGKDTGIFDESGKMSNNYQKAIIADATGALICGPCGTSTMTSFAESSVGVNLGAKTGLAACVSGLMFLLSAFIYPIFSVFTAGSVTCAALVVVGAQIFVNNLKDIKWKDSIIGFTAFITVIFTLLSYSIAKGIGMGLIVYIVMSLFARKGKEIKIPIYIIAALFIVSFVLDAILMLI